MFSSLTSKLKQSLSLEPTDEQKRIQLQQYKRERFELLRELRAAVQAVIELAATTTTTKAAADSKQEKNGDDITDTTVATRELDEREVAVKDMMIWLERCVWHGMKNNVIVKRGENVVTVHLSLWNLIRHLPEVCEKSQQDPCLQTLYQLRDLLFVKSNIGRGRAWLRIALNGKVLDTALGKLVNQQAIMSRYYLDFALLCDEEASSILLAIVTGLNGLAFNFHIDEARFDKEKEPIRRPFVMSPNVVKTIVPKPDSSGTATTANLKVNTIKAKHAADSNQEGWGSVYDAVLDKATRVLSTNNSTSTNSDDVLLSSISCGKSLDVLVRNPLTCDTALLDYRVGVPNIIARCVSLLWNSPELYTKGLFSNHPPAEIARKLIKDTDKPFKLIMKERMLRVINMFDDMGGDGLSILTHVGVDVEFDVAAESVSAVTSASFTGSKYAEYLDSYTVAQTLILFLEQLPDQLLPSETYEAFLACLSIGDIDVCIRNFECLVDTLPFENKATLDLLLSLYNRITHPLEQKNETNIPALKVEVAESMARALMRPLFKSQDSEKAVEVAMILIENQKVILENARTSLNELRGELASKTSRLRQISEGLSRPLDFENPEANKLFRYLWENLGNEPDEYEFEAISKGWCARGFQTENALLDYRGGGFTALRDTCYFVDHHRAQVGKMVQKSPDVLPFILCSVQVTRMVADMLCLTGHEFSDSGANSPGKRDKIAVLPWWNLLSEEHATERIFSMAFILLDINFTQSKASRNDFYRIKQETKVQMLRLLNLGPKTVDDLWHSWIKLRAMDRRAEVDSDVNNNIVENKKEEPTSDTVKSLETKNEEVEENKIEKVETEKDDKVRKERVESDLAQLQQYLPNLLTSSEVLTQSHIAKLEAALPASYQGYNWTLVFSTTKHGGNLPRLYQLAKNYQSTILVVKDVNGVVFGGFTATQWKIESEYFGTGESFLFSFKDGFQAYRWTEKNSYFMLSNEDSMAMGGGGGFGLFLDEDLKGGTSGPCETYGNQCLSSDEDFTLVVLELWSFILK